MPRHKRQRPAYLPRWIPFKEGRILGLARQTLVAWVSAGLALAFFLMTVCYGIDRSRFTTLSWVISTSSNAILVLRLLSEAAGLFLGATIHSTFEVIQWVKISRPHGLPFPEFLALQSSTGTLGLLVLAFGRGLKPSEWPMKPRFMSLVRLISVFVVPVLGVLIMGNVNTYAVYLPLRNSIQPFAFGMEAFNGSVASQLGVMEDLLFNIDYVSFLSNPLHAVDLTTKAEKSSGCSQGVSHTANHSCIRRVLVTQELQNVNANFSATKDLDAEVVLSSNQQAYSLEYQDNVVTNSEHMTCELLHSGPAYYRICMHNTSPSTMLASLTPCPAALMMSSTCTQNTTWQSSPGYTTSFTPSFQNATVAYSRLDNGHILSHTLHSAPTPAPMNATDVLFALTVLLNASTTPDNTTLSTPILGQSSHFFGRLVAGHMYRLGIIIAKDPTQRVRGANALQSLIAITLYYCQNGVLAQTVMPFAASGSNTTLASTGPYSKQGPSSTIALAKTQYNVQVGRATLYAYIILGGLALTICIITLFIGSLVELAKFDAEPTLYPSLDFWTQCRVEMDDGVLVPVQKREDLAWMDAKEGFRELAGLRVSRRKRKMRDGGEMELPDVEVLVDGK